MAKINGKARLTVAEQQTVLKSLNQQTVGWLLVRSTPWLRENPSCFDRNPDGTYDCRQLFSYVSSTATKVEPAELDDAAYESMSQALEESCWLIGNQAEHFLEVIGELVDESGEVETLAAIGQFVRDRIEAITPHLAVAPRDATTIRTEKLAEAEREISALPREEARTELRLLPVCHKCGNHRFGRSWRKGTVPAGWVADEARGICDDCFGG